MVFAGAAGGAVVSVVVRAVDKFSKTFATAETQMKGLTGFVAQHQAAFLGAGAAVTGFGILGVAAMSSLVKSASTLQEVQNKFDVVFKDNEKAANSFVKELMDGYVMSERASKQYMSAFQDLFVPMGVARDKATELSGGLVKLAADVGSFNNVATDKVILDFQSALVGNHETVKKYGIILTETTLKQKAFDMGIGDLISDGKKLKGTLTEQEKLQVRMAILYAGSADAIGDTARSAGTYEHATKQLNATLEDLRTSLGTHLLPLFTRIIEKITAVVDWFNNLSAGQKKFIVIAGAVATVLALVIGPLLMLVAMLPLIAAGLTAVTAAGFPLWGIVLIIIGVIAALITIGWLLIKHWDKVKGAAMKLGVILKNVFIGIHNVVMKVWNGIVNHVQKSINRIINMVNKVIRSMNKIPGINIGRIRSIGLERYKGTMMKYASYAPTAPESSGGTTKVTNINIENINGLTGEDLAVSLQDELNKRINPTI